MTLTYVVNSLFYSLIGAVVGYQYCKMKIDLSQLKRQANMDGDTESTSVAASLDNPIQPRRKGFGHLSTMQIVGAVVVLMAIVSTSMSAYQSTRLNKISGCLADYAADHAAALRARDEVSARSRQDARAYNLASDNLWLGLVRTAGPAGKEMTKAEQVLQREASLRVLDDYLQSSKTYRGALDAVDKARADFPIPVNRCADPSVQ